MRRGLLLAVALALLFGRASPGYAAGYFDSTVAALKGSNVYVAPLTAGSTADTENDLKQQLNGGDNIALVMLPQAALSEFGDIQTFAKKLDDATGHRLIIGLAIGDSRLGYSTLLPASTASDLMERAVSVSTSVPESLGTFARSVHNWQRQNASAPAAKPQPKPTAKTAPKKTSNSFPWAAIPIGVALGLLGAALLRKILRGSESSNEKERVEFHSTPRQVRQLLDDILQLRSQINDQSLCDIITQIGRDSEAYFRRIENAKNEIEAFKTRLEEIQRILVKYIDVQDNERYYYPHWAKHLQEGRESVVNFAEFLLARIRKESELSMMDYYVDTKILAAQKYR